MAIPDKPLSRLEQYLDAIATNTGGGGGGSGGGVLVVNCAYDEETGEDVFDKTWAEINDAPLAVVRKSGNGYAYSEIVSYYFSDYDDEKEADVYFVITMRADLENGDPKVVALKYVADSPNEPPYGPIF